MNQLLSNKNIEISTIAQAESQVNDQSFATALNDLQQHLYGKSALVGAPSWQGDTLLASIQKLNKQKQEKKTTNEKHSLNP